MIEDFFSGKFHVAKYIIYSCLFFYSLYLYRNHNIIISICLNSQKKNQTEKKGFCMMFIIIGIGNGSFFCNMHDCSLGQTQIPDANFKLATATCIRQLLVS